MPATPRFASALTDFTAALARSNTPGITDAQCESYWREASRVVVALAAVFAKTPADLAVKVEIAERDRDVVGCVIDQDIKAAEGLGDFTDQPIHVRAVGDVASESLSLDLMTRRQFASDAFRLFTAARVVA